MDVHHFTPCPARVSREFYMPEWDDAKSVTMSASNRKPKHFAQSGFDDSISSLGQTPHKLARLTRTRVY